MGAITVAALFCGTFAFVKARLTATTVRLAYIPIISNTQAIVGAARGDFKSELGMGAKLLCRAFKDEREEMKALATGQADICYVDSCLAINEYAHYKDNAYKIVAGAASGGSALVVRDGAGITRPAELVGKKIGTSGLYTTQNISLKHYLDTVLNLESINNGGNDGVVFIKSQDPTALLKSGIVDAAWLPEPWVSKVLNEKYGRVLIDEQDLWPNRQYSTALIVVRTQFLNEHPDLVYKFLKSHAALTKWINSNMPDAQRVVISELRRLTGKSLSVKIIKDAYKRVQVTNDPILSSIEEYANWSYQLAPTGRIPPCINSLCDTTLLKRVLSARMIALAKTR